MTTTLRQSAPAIDTVLEELARAREQYQQAKQSQKNADALINTIRQRKKQTETEAQAANDQWRRLFNENDGSQTKEMKKLRTECALAKDTIEEFENLITARLEENALLPSAVGDAAASYIRAHNKAIELHAENTYRSFMAAQGEALLQMLRLKYLAFCNARQGNAGWGVYDGLNDADTLLLNFVKTEITDKALRHSPSVGTDELLNNIGISTGQQAHADRTLRLSPAKRNVMARKLNTSNGGQHE